jgi:hypothetical protein
MIKINSTRTSQRVIRVINNHQNLANNFGVIDLFSIGFIRSKSEWFRSDRSCNVNIDLSTKLAKRYNVLLVFAYCYLAANLPSPFSWNVTDVVNGVIMSVSFEDRTVLLSIDTLNSWLNIVDSSCFYNFPCIFDVISDNCFIFRLLIFSHYSIVQNSALEPWTLVNADICWKCCIFFWRFHFSQFSHCFFIKLISRLDFSLIHINNVELKRIGLRHRCWVVGCKIYLEIRALRRPTDRQSRVFSKYISQHLSFSVD